MAFLRQSFVATAIGIIGSCLRLLYSKIGCSILANSLGCVAQGLPTHFAHPTPLRQTGSLYHLNFSGKLFYMKDSPFYLEGLQNL